MCMMRTTEDATVQSGAKIESARSREKMKFWLTALCTTIITEGIMAVQDISIEEAFGQVHIFQSLRVDAVAFYTLSTRASPLLSQ